MGDAKKKKNGAKRKKKKNAKVFEFSSHQSCWIIQ